MKTHRTLLRERHHARDALVKHLERRLRSAHILRPAFRIADGVLESSRTWVAEFTCARHDLEPMAASPCIPVGWAARIDTQMLADQSRTLRQLLQEAMGDDPHATLR